MANERIGLAGRTIVVAGAGGGGIGTAVCRSIAEAGGDVVALDNDATHLEPAADAVTALGARVYASVTDVRDPHAIDAALAAVGPVHGLVHVAGGLRPDQWEPTAREPLATFDEVLDLNLRSAFVTSQAVGVRLIDQQTSGSIVHIASIAALTAMPFGAPYAVAKAGLLALMRTQAVEWGPYGIRVNAIAAGTVRTPKSEREGNADRAEDNVTVPLRRRGVPDDIAGAVLFLLSDLAAFVTGHTLAVDGGASVRPGYLDADDMPVFVRDDALRARLRGD